MKILKFLDSFFIEKDTGESDKYIKQIEDNKKEESNKILDDFINDKITIDELLSPNFNADVNKKSGNIYEKYIGNKFEEKGELVIYNGFLLGCKDNGIDVISISSREKSINLIQCKNWINKPLNISHIQDIYEKLNKFKMDFYFIDSKYIQNELNIKMPITKCNEILHEVKSNLSFYTIRKTLYIGSHEVIHQNVKSMCQIIKPNIWKYYDLKIVIKRLND